MIWMERKSDYDMKFSYCPPYEHGDVDRKEIRFWHKVAQLQAIIDFFVSPIGSFPQ